jgi:hypothetical protein
MIIHQSRFIQLAEQLGRLWAGIWSERSGAVESIRTEMDALAAQAGLELDLARRLAPESLALLVSPGGEPDPARGWLLAELLYLSGRLAEREGDRGGADDCDRRALDLYRLLDPERLPTADLPEVGTRIADLEERLSAPG